MNGLPPLLIEELARALLEERQREAARALARGQGRRGLPLRSRLARTLVQTGIRLDGSASEDALRAVANRPCQG